MDSSLSIKRLCLWNVEVPIGSLKFIYQSIFLRDPGMLCHVLLHRRICIEQKVSTFSKAKETQYFQGFLSNYQFYVVHLWYNS